MTEDILNEKQTEPDLLPGICRQKKREQTHKGDDGCRQDHVNDVVQWTPLQTDSVRNIHVWFIEVVFRVSFKRNLCTKTRQFTQWSVHTIIASEKVHLETS